jgi:hypothetical protein
MAFDPRAVGRAFSEHRFDEALGHLAQDVRWTMLARRLRRMHEPHEAVDVPIDVVAVDETRTAIQDLLVRHFVEHMKTSSWRGHGLAPPAVAGDKRRDRHEQA